jgi:RNA polymerase-interacting CarD/CdnL/TRCF family regulator
VHFVAETRQRRKAHSDSEALDLLLRELMRDTRRQEIDAAYKEFYDSASDEQLADELAWAEMAGPNVLLSGESEEAYL